MAKRYINNRLLNYGVLGIITILTFIATIFISIEHFNKVEKLSQQVAISENIILDCRNILLSALDYESQSRGFALKKDTAFLTNLPALREGINKDIINIKTLISNSDIETDSLKSLIFIRLAKSDTLVSKAKKGTLNDPPKSIHHIVGKTIMDNVKKLTSQIESKAKNRLETEKQDYYQSLSKLYWSLILLVILIINISFYLVVKTRKDLKLQRLATDKLNYINLLFNSGNYAMISTDENFNVINWNKGAEKIYGYTQEEALGKSATQMVGAQTTEEEKISIQNELKQKGYWRGEVIQKNKQGEMITVFGALSAFINSKGKITGYTTINNDITELVKTREKVVLFDHIIDNAQEAIIMSDTDLKITKWNKGAEKLYGYKENEVLGIKSIDLFQSDITQIEKENIYKTIFANGHWNGYLPQRNKNKEIIHIWCSISTIKDKDNNNTGIIAFNSDMTSLIKAKNQVSLLEKMTESTSDAIIIMDNDFRIEFWNPGAFTLYGYTNDEAIGTSLIKLLKIPLNDNQIGNYKSVLEQSELWTGEIKQIDKNGNTLFVLSSITAIKNAYGNIEKYVIVNKDITELKAQKLKLKEVNQQLEAVLMEKSELLTEMYDRISDAFVSIDKDWKYVFVNKKAGEILDRDPAYLVGKTIWDEYPEAVNFHFYKAFQEAMTKKIHIQFEDYFPNVDKWLENNIYPSDKGINVYYRDTTVLKKSKEELMELNVQLRTFNTKLENAIEEERKFIAQEIHDQLGQQMTALKIDIVWIKKKIPEQQTEIITKINEVISGLEENINSIRKLSLNLRPSILDDLGLLAALDWQYKEFEKRCNIICTFTHDIDDVNLPSNIRNTIFRISQEALTNIMRHSNASKIAISLIQKDETLLLMIIDDGIGFNVNEKNNHFGLLSMKERAISIKGDLRITSVIGIGTTIKLIIRIPHNK